MNLHSATIIALRGINIMDDLKQLSNDELLEQLDITETRLDLSELLLCNQVDNTYELKQKKIISNIKSELRLRKVKIH